VTQGFSVSLSADGETVAIGSRLYGSTDAGRVRVFRYNGGTSSWDPYGFAIVGPIANGQFVISPKAFRMFNIFVVQGYSVSLSNDGDTVAIGAPYGAGNLGRTYVYYRDGSGWSQRGTVIHGESGSGNYYSVISKRPMFSSRISYSNQGYSVALSGDATTVVIGADQNSGAGTFAGHARVFRYNGVDWIQRGGDIDGEFAQDYSVMLSHIALHRLSPQK
jgi:hypothetical protein